MLGLASVTLLSAFAYILVSERASSIYNRNAFDQSPPGQPAHHTRLSVSKLGQRCWPGSALVSHRVRHHVAHAPCEAPEGASLRALRLRCRPFLFLWNKQQANKKHYTR